MSEHIEINENETKDTARQVNPIVAKAAEQVGRAKARQPKPKDVPRGDCPGQLSLFAPEKDR
ncbi:MULTISPECIES: hypothetical protein [unclassified Nocardia]|uniref:hypothetical protein n=1 Tax=unclassified Nocardia TaxID=2637762 RepID=UPI001CE4B548|nr:MULTISPECIES: hypothetical protein [unclassified Nocardia]